MGGDCIEQHRGKPQGQHNDAVICPGIFRAEKVCCESRVRGGRAAVAKRDDADGNDIAYALRAQQDNARADKAGLTYDVVLEGRSYRRWSP
jgi:hypothetical protein